jgi:hypothetical protein
VSSVRAAPHEGGAAGGHHAYRLLSGKCEGHGGAALRCRWVPAPSVVFVEHGQAPHRSTIEQLAGVD